MTLHKENGRQFLYGVSPEKESLSFFFGWFCLQGRYAPPYLERGARSAPTRSEQPVRTMQRTSLLPRRRKPRRKKPG